MQDQRQVDELFEEARRRTPGQARAQYLDAACGDDSDLKRRVERLLKAFDDAGSFLDPPASHPASTIDQPVTEQPGTQIGPYKLLQQLGEGGMGVVYLAEQESPIRRRVALKIIKAGMNTRQVIARFEQERQVLALMDHPHIAKVLDAGAVGQAFSLSSDSRRQAESLPHEGRPFFVMELVRGIPLTRFCDQQHLTPQQRLELFLPVCQAVQHAHQKGIIHRDLKPSNVLVALYDGHPVPKVIDFGVAKAIHQKLTEQTMFTEVGSIVGTLEYMAPEQAELNNLDIDTRADIYSLGVMMYELMTGSPPFTARQLRGAAFAEMLRMIREVDPPKPSTKLSSSDELPAIAANRKLEPRRLTSLVSGELDWIVMKALEKDRSRRYETANDLGLDVQRFLNHEPVLAGRPSTFYLLRKFVRRHQGPALAVTLILAALVVGSVVATFGWIEARRQTQLARQSADRETTARLNESQQRQQAEANADQAQQQEQKAQRQLEVAQAVVEFLTEDLLAPAGSRHQADGKFTPQPNLTVREALDRAAAKVATKFASQPQLEASTRNVIGAAYIELGQYDDAVVHLRRAADLSQQQFGSEDPNTLTARHNLAQAHLQAGRTAEAVSEYEQVYAARVKMLGPDDPETLATLNNLGLACVNAGKTAEAIRYLQQALDNDTTRRGPDDRLTLLVGHSLAVAYRAAGHLPQAIQTLEQIREAHERVFGAEHADTLVMLSSLALMYYEMGRNEEAIPLFQRVVDSQAKTLGPQHNETLATRNYLALAYRARGDFADAIRLLKEVSDAQAAQLGRDHPLTMATLHNLALAYGDVGKQAESRAILEPLLAAATRTLKADHPHTLTILRNLAVTHLQDEEPDAAIRLLEPSRQVHEKALGPDHPDTLEMLNYLAIAYGKSGEVAKAIALLEDVCSLSEKNPGPDHPATWTAQANLAVEYWRNKQFDKAIPLFERHLQHKKKSPGERHPDTLLTMANLGICYRDVKRYDEAIELLERVCRDGREYPSLAWARNVLVATYGLAGRREQAVGLARQNVQEARAQSPDGSTALASDLVVCGTQLLDLHAWSDAESILREVLAIRQRTEPEAWTTFNTISLLGGSLTGQQRFAEAEPLLLQGYEGLKQREATIPESARVRILESVDRLIELCTDTDKPDEAKKWQTERTKYLPPATPATEKL